MKDRVGLWIDHKKAVIVKNNELITVVSNIEDVIRSDGNQFGKTTHGDKDFPKEDQLDRHIMDHLNKFYTEVSERINKAPSIIIMGPGEAKFELEKILTHAGLKKNICGVEKADKLTDRQIAARVREYYSNKQATTP